MFDVFPKALASVASFLFPLFASYKALNSADPAQLTPWLMYWVVLSCLVFVESWVDWLLVWIPFYHYFRLFFLLYLVLPQTQGARVLYQTHLHPWLAQHEARIDEFIGSAHDRLRSAGMHYLREAIAYVRGALGLPSLASESASAPAASSSSSSSSSSPFSSSPQGYTQALLARFTLPSARWPGGAAGAAAAGTAPGGSTAAGASPADLYNLLSSAVGALGTATGAAGGAAASAFSSSAPQRERLRTLLSALDREAAQQQQQQQGGESLSRPPSGSSGSGGGLSKSRSEADFEKIDAESGTEEEQPGAGGVRQRRPGASAATAAAADDDDHHHPGTTDADAGRGAQGRTASGSWKPWAWGAQQ